MDPRPHRERLLHDLKEIRDELVGEINRVKPEEFDVAPAEGAKSYKALLQEIATMEKLCAGWVSTGSMPDWETAIAWSGNDIPSILADIEKVRAETTAYLEEVDEAGLQTPKRLPEDWWQYFPVKDIEPEEMIRWVIRHEYYHLGQIITYRWLAGDNPYSRG